MLEKLLERKEKASSRLFGILHWCVDSRENKKEKVNYWMSLWRDSNMIRGAVMVPDFHIHYIKNCFGRQTCQTRTNRYEGKKIELENESCGFLWELLSIILSHDSTHYFIFMPLKLKIYKPKELFEQTSSMAASLKRTPFSSICSSASTTTSAGPRTVVELKR